MIDLPATPTPQVTAPFLRTFGGVLTPYLGGPEQQIVRLGTRLGIRVTMPPLRTPEDGRLFVSRLIQAKVDRLRMAWPLDGFDPGSTGAPKVNGSVSGGMSLPIKGLPAAYHAREGQPLSIVHAGNRYLHLFSADSDADGSGNMTGAIFPPLRVALADNDVIELAQPMIEGLVLPGDELNWENSVARRTSIAFSVVESR